MSPETKRLNLYNKCIQERAKIRFGFLSFDVLCTLESQNKIDVQQTECVWVEA